MPAEQQSAINTDTQRFTGYLADTRESRRIHYRIRYQVYCERKGFEDNPVLRKRGLERDAFDGHALPFIIWDHSIGRWRGVARLILGTPDALPVSQLRALDEDIQSSLPTEPMAELSRLAAIRYPQEFGATRWALLNATFATVFSAARRFQIDRLVFLAAPSLARVLSSLGFSFTSCGPYIRHRGRRRAYIGDINQALAHLRHMGYKDGFGYFSEISTHKSDSDSSRLAS